MLSGIVLPCAPFPVPRWHAPRRLKPLKGEARSPIPAGCMRSSSRHAPGNLSTLLRRGPEAPCVSKRECCCPGIFEHILSRIPVFYIVEFETLRNATHTCLGCHLQSHKHSILRVRFETFKLRPVVSSSFYTRWLYVSSPRTQQTPLGALPSNNSGNINHRHSRGISVSHRLDK